jgi:hypothetical protein
MWRWKLPARLPTAQQLMPVKGNVAMEVTCKITDSTAANAGEG